MRSSSNSLLINHSKVACQLAPPSCDAVRHRSSNSNAITERTGNGRSVRRGNWLVFCGSTLLAQLASGQDVASNRHYDPATGITYERQIRTVDQPTVETVMESKVVTYSRPELVTETEPVTRNYWTPVVQYEWQPRWRGLWNPFTPATLEYQYVPQTRWEARSETYSRLKSSTRWISEQRVTNEPRLVTSIKKQQVEEWVAVGRSAPNSGNASTFAGTNANAIDSTRVATLPANPNSTLRPLSAPLQSPSASSIRPSLSGGMRPTVLDPYSTRSYSNGSIFR